MAEALTADRKRMAGLVEAAQGLSEARRLAMSPQAIAAAKAVYEYRVQQYTDPLGSRQKGREQ